MEDDELNITFTDDSFYSTLETRETKTEQPKTIKKDERRLSSKPAKPSQTAEEKERRALKKKKIFQITLGLLAVGVGFGLIFACINADLPWWATACVGVVVLLLWLGGSNLADRWLS